MVGQHDATGADANRGGAAGNMANQHGGRRARDPRHPVMLGQPKTPIAPTLGAARQVERVLKGVGRIASVCNGREIQDGKRGHAGYGGGTVNHSQPLDLTKYIKVFSLERIPSEPHASKVVLIVTTALLMIVAATIYLAFALARRWHLVRGAAPAHGCEVCKQPFCQM
jgi:hypothetical protein